MATKTRIEWTQMTWNPVTGCSKISLGCRNCYAERMARRLCRMGSARYRHGFEVSLHEDLVTLPIRWRSPRSVFVNSMSDLFHEEVPLAFIQSVFETMRQCRQHRFQVLTKRAGRLAELCRDPAVPHLNRPESAQLLSICRIEVRRCPVSCREHIRTCRGPERSVSEPFGLYGCGIAGRDLQWSDNIWMGVTVESSDYLHRIDLLRRVPAKVRFLSLEPLLGPVSSLDLSGNHWVIVGGESGPGARRMDAVWVEAVHQLCAVANVPFFFKQWGGVRKGLNGRELFGRTYDELPSVAT